LIVNIQLVFESKEAAMQTFSAISPDNSPLPEGLEIECSTDNQIVKITIQSSRSLESMAATLEDMMSAIDLSMRTSDAID
jgi:hypothetical protein